jgi:hypothetical protein
MSKADQCRGRYSVETVAWGRKCLSRGIGTLHIPTNRLADIIEGKSPLAQFILEYRSIKQRNFEASFIIEICALLGYYSGSSGNPLPTFRDKLSVPCARVKKSKKKADLLNIATWSHGISIVIWFLRGTPIWISYVMMSIRMRVVRHVARMGVMRSVYTGCSRQNVSYFGRRFLRLNSIDITKHTYIRIWTVTEMMAR